MRALPMRMPKIITIVALCAVLGGCGPSGELAGFDKKDSHDRFKKLSREDFRNMQEPVPIPPLASGATSAPDLAPIPDIAEMLTAPRPPKINHGKLVSISVTDDVPLRDVLFELSRLADVDIELGGNITGGVNFRAKDKPFNDVIERISDLAGLRYSMRNGVLRVERDTPYIKNYSLDFLNIVRSSQSTISLSTDVLSASVGGGESGSSSGSSSGGSSGGSSGSTIQTGTSSSVNSTAESDLWAALDASVAEILSYRPNFDANVDEATTGTAGGASGGAGAGYVINRQAGILSANATERQHEIIQKFLSLMKRNASAQVLIEAKLVEVTLEDKFRSGIDWDLAIGRLRTNFNLQPTTAISSTQGISLSEINGASPSLEDVVNLVQEFGTSRTLSSPRLHAINNQQAVLTVAENRIFFTCNQDSAASTTTGTGSTTTTGAAFQCEQGSVPIGILLSILPSINLETSEVTLNVRPTLSRQVDDVADPGTAISLAAASTGAGALATSALSAIENAIPVIEVRELDSIMKVKNGGVMVIGGLMEEVSTSADAGTPGLSEIPFLGNAFKTRNDSTEKRELVIFIKATIVDSDGSYVPADKRVYEKFTTDPRPLNL